MFFPSSSHCQLFYMSGHKMLYNPKSIPRPISNVSTQRNHCIQFEKVVPGDSRLYPSTQSHSHWKLLLYCVPFCLTHAGWGQRLHINSTLQWIPMDAASFSSWCRITGSCWSQGSLWFSAVFCSCFFTSQLFITRTKAGQGRAYITQVNR